jgi:WD40 repeat protein
MSSIQPNPAQLDLPAPSGDTITVGDISGSLAVAIGYDAIAQVFQQILPTAPTDFRYLARKLLLRTLLLAATDLRVAEVDAPYDEALQLLRRIIVHAGHLFSVCPVEPDLAATLLSRIAFDAPLRHSTAALARTLPRPYWTPSHPLPNRPDPALIRILNSHTNTLTGCAVSPDGAWLVSADGTVRLWDTQSSMLQRTLVGYTGKATACAFSPDGIWLVSAAEDGRVWLGMRRVIHCLAPRRGQTEEVTSCAFSPDGTWLVSTADVETVWLWDAQSGALLRTLTRHTNEVTNSALSPDDA